MAVVSKLRALNWVLLAVAAQGLIHAQAPPIQTFQIHITEPAYTGLPVWIQADFKSPNEVRYPYHEDPSDIGPNRLEVRRGDQSLKPVPFQPWFGGGGIQDGSIAPPDSPTNRLPLHLLYALNEPGMYSVRWTEVRHTVPTMTEVIVAQSDWVTFELKQSTPEQREAWLQSQLAAVPDESGPGQLVGDFFPSLLAEAPDPRVLQVILDQLYSTQSIVRSCALASLRLFHEEDLRTQVADLVRRQGPSDAIAYLLSWRAPLFQDNKEDLVLAILPYLHSTVGWQVAATLKTLMFLVHAGNFHWPNAEVPTRADKAVLAVAPELIGKSADVAQLLAEYLGGIKNNAARALLWELAERPGPEHEQALIALTWIGDAQDLPRLAELLLKPGGG